VTDVNTTTTTMMWSTSIVLLLSALSLSILSQASADSQGVFELKLMSFLNRAGKDSSGHCCDGYRTSSGKCSGKCNTKFRVCLKHYQATIDPSNECTFGEAVTPVLGNNVATLEPIRFPIDFKWPGTFSLIIEAWHENNNATSADSALISRLATQQRLSAGSDWTQGEHQ
jgi:delta-like protein